MNRMKAIRTFYGKSERPVAEMLGKGQESLRRYERMDSAVNLDILLKFAQLWGYNPAYVAGENAPKLHPAFVPYIQQFLDFVGERRADFPARDAIRYLTNVAPDLFTRDLFILRLRLTAPEEFDMLLGGIPVGAITAEALEDLLGLPAVWWMSGAPSDLPDHLMSDGDKLLNEVRDWGLDIEDIRACRHIILAARGKQEAGQH